MSNRRFFRRQTPAAVCLAVATLALTGCGNFWQAITTTTTGTGTGYDIVYAGKNSTSTLVGYDIASTGLTAVTGSPYTLSAPPLALAVAPNNNFLYVGTANGIFAYSIASGGQLTALNSGTVIASGYSPAWMDVSPDGNYLAVLTTNASLGIYVYPISTSTGLNTSTGTEMPTVPATGIPQMIKFSPLESTQNTSVVAASFGTGGIYLYTFSGGALSYASQITPGVNTDSFNNLAWNTGGTELFFTSGGGDDTLYCYSINTTTGYPAASALATTTTGANPVGLTFNQAQTYMYVANAGSIATPGYTLSGYDIASSPVFTTMSSSPFSTSGYLPSAIAFDNSGFYILAMTQTGTDDLVQYTIDTGTVAPGRLDYTDDASTATTATGTSSGGVVMVTTH